MEDTTTTGLTKADEKGLGIFAGIRDRCSKLLGEDRFLREASFAVQIIAANPGLMACTNASKLAAMVNVANTGLTLNPVMKLAYLIPRNVKVKGENGADRWEKRLAVEPSYVGLMKVATDTGSVKHFDAQVVYTGDEFSFDKGAKRIVHVPYWTRGAERGDIIGAYSIATLVDGSILIEDMGADELALIRSKSDNANGSVYKDWAGEMARKALIKRQCKYLPKSERNEALMAAIAIDDEGFDALPMSEDKRAELTLRDRVREALDFYQGEDKEDIRDLCRQKTIAGEFTEMFAKNVLAQMGAQP